MGISPTPQFENAMFVVENLSSLPVPNSFTNAVFVSNPLSNPIFLSRRQSLSSWFQLVQFSQRQLAVSRIWECHPFANKDLVNHCPGSPECNIDGCHKVSHNQVLSFLSVSSRSTSSQRSPRSSSSVRSLRSYRPPKSSRSSKSPRRLQGHLPFS